MYPDHKNFGFGFDFSRTSMGEFDRFFVHSNVIFVKNMYFCGMYVKINVNIPNKIKRNPDYTMLTTFD